MTTAEKLLPTPTRSDHNDGRTRQGREPDAGRRGGSREPDRRRPIPREADRPDPTTPDADLRGWGEHLEGRGSERRASSGRDREATPDPERRRRLGAGGDIGEHPPTGRSGRDAPDDLGEPGEGHRPATSDAGELGRGSRPRGRRGSDPALRSQSPDVAGDGRGEAPPDPDRLGRDRLETLDGAHRGVDISPWSDADRRGDVDRWGAYAGGIARWEEITGRRAPDPTDGGRLNQVFVEWMMGFPEGWVTELVDRRPALRLLGNAVVPAQAFYALELLAR